MRTAVCQTNRVRSPRNLGQLLQVRHTPTKEICPSPRLRWHYVGHVKNKRNGRSMALPRDASDS